MPSYYNYQNNSGQGGGNGLWSWIVILIALTIFWPVGLVLLFRKLMGRPAPRMKGNGGRVNWNAGTSRHPYDMERETAQSAQQEPQQEAPRQKQAQEQKKADYSYNYQYYGKTDKKGKKEKKAKKQKDGLPTGRSLTVWGGILAAVGAFMTIALLPDMLWYIQHGFSIADELVGVAMSTGMFGAGLVMAYCGAVRGKKAKRYRKYLALIGRRESISVAALAQAMPTSYRSACADLQDMLDEGYLPAGYIDAQSGRLNLSEEGIVDDWEPPKAEPEPAKKAEDDDEILAEIRRIDDAIDDPEMSRKISRIGEITGKILAYQRNNPTKANQLNSFLSYYLPTTLKILNAYAQLESQGIEGENITAAKARIEGMMDKVVEGFEKQLDRLFQNDAMDITTDVSVLENMMDSDGLSNRQGLQI